MKRLSLFLLLIGVIVGLVAQQPAQAFAVPPGAMDMAVMSESDMASMPDCMPSVGQHPTHAPCKCGVAGCIAMIALGVPMLLAEGPLPFPAAIASERDGRIGTSAELRGRSTAPEPEPPSIL